MLAVALDPWISQFVCWLCSPSAMYMLLVVTKAFKPAMIAVSGVDCGQTGPAYGYSFCFLVRFALTESQSAAAYRATYSRASENDRTKRQRERRTLSRQICGRRTFPRRTIDPCVYSLSSATGLRTKLFCEEKKTIEVSDGDWTSEQYGYENQP